jgi:xylulokinase
VSVLGIDIGTTGTKAVVISDRGSVLGHAYRGYRLIVPANGWAEIDPRAVWRAARDSATEAIDAAGVAPRSVGIAGPGEAFVPLDEAGKPLGNAIVSFDQRSSGAFSKVVSQIGVAELRRQTGQEPLSHYALFKWLWWRDEQPDLDRITVRFASLAGYVAERFGAVGGIDRSLATRTSAYDPGTGEWAHELLGRLGLDPARLPKIRNSGDSSGQVRADVARSIGCASSAEVVIVGLDQACAAMGVLLDGDAALLSVGTTAVIARVAATSPSKRTALPSVPHVDDVNTLVLAGSPGGGSALRWFRDTFARRTGFESIIESTTDRPTAVLFLAHLGGSRIAFADPSAKGAFSGITFDSDRIDLARAVLDGVAYEVAMLLRRFLEDGLTPSHLIAVGGASKSSVWMQIMSDAIGLPIASTGSSLAAAYGAARVAAGVHPSEGDALGPMPIEFAVTPRERWHSYHQARIALAEATHDALRSVRQLGERPASKVPSR